MPFARCVEGIATDLRMSYTVNGIEYSMGLNDEIKKAAALKDNEVQLETQTREMQNKELEARDLLYRAANMARPSFGECIGVSAIFFYRTSPQSAEYRTFISMTNVSEPLAARGHKQFNEAYLEAYHLDLKGKRKVN